MLYIHELRQFSAANAEIESVPIIRELKKSFNLPLDAADMRKQFVPFFITQAEIHQMQKALDLIPKASSLVAQMEAEADPLYERISLQRAIAMLAELPGHLENNIRYFHDIAEWQESSLVETLDILRQIKYATPEQKKSLNTRLNAVFEKLLRHNQFTFHSADIVHEGPKARVNHLNECMEQGFFFRMTLENQIKQERFSDIVERLPQQALVRVDGIHRQIEDIKKGIDTAYACNLRMAEWAVVLYAFVKWILSS
ncbi:MAG TPA: hypothetical protein VK158_06510 [Acidobacteriota bacterium]|nr:hypothetical protein [Acidobacteriota bacterium]